jgi:hypothetical protein
MARRIDWQRNRKQKTLVENGFEKWDGSVMGEGLGKLPDQRHGPQSTRTNASAETQPIAKKSKSKKPRVTRIAPGSDKGKEIAEAALKKLQNRQPYKQSTKATVLHASQQKPSDSMAPFINPKPSRTDASRQVKPQPPSSSRNMAQEPSRRSIGYQWLLWLFPCLLLIVLVFLNK